MLTFPTPCLVVLIGIPGAGKTTWAAQHFEPNEIVSSDDCALRVCDGGYGADRWTRALVELTVEARCANRRRVVVDALNTDAERRRRWVAIAAPHDVPAQAVMIHTPAWVAIRRQEIRREQGSHPYPAGAEGVLLEQTRFRAALSQIYDEGFAVVRHVMPDA